MRIGARPWIIWPIIRWSRYGQLGAMGFCIGGHLAFRAALDPDVRATVCFYGTGIHDGKLGQDRDAGSLARAGEIRGKLLMVWGSADPHVPEAGRAADRSQAARSQGRLCGEALPRRTRLYAR